MQIKHWSAVAILGVLGTHHSLSASELEKDTENKITLHLHPLTKAKKIGLSHITLDFSGLAIPQNIFSHALSS